MPFAEARAGGFDFDYAAFDEVHALDGDEGKRDEAIGALEPARRFEEGDAPGGWCFLF